ncbi:M50 family metallopeptidase [Kocuria sp.]|uniref:M50 family metallopeptidase n=1 Tax=Kocuria sp. TaxID=1871328 RepID=UPI0026DF5828|nr:M50 family metallopeptidase [Kocuria sp.]MDO5618915.1 M50 family metallopeptidase [Kocuria sp.]
MTLSEFLGGLFTPSPVPPADTWVLVLCAAAAVVISIPRGTWRWFGLVVTVVHELGHALAGLLTGRRVMQIRINADHSGVTHSMGRGASAMWSTFWGYPFPAVVGAAWTAAVGAGYWPLAAVVSAVVLVVSLLVMRGWLSWLVTTTTAVILLALAWYQVTPGRWFMLAVGAALWIGALRAWINLARQHARSRRVPTSDATLLAAGTGVPAWLWLLAFLGVILLCGFWIVGAWI